MANKKDTYHSGPGLDESREDAQHEKEFPVHQETRNDENNCDVWNLCFGWQAREEPKEQIEGPRDLQRGQRS
jgi:hypothetical protein